LFLGANVAAEDLPPKATLNLNFPTHVSNTLADWDSVWVIIVQADSRIDSVKLASAGDGLWYGSISLDGYTAGSYSRYYCGYEGAIVMCDALPFSVIDTTELQGGGWGGVGSYKDTIIVLDADTNTVEGVDITVRNTSGTVIAFGRTDVNGMDILNLDAATYFFSVQRTGIIFDDDTTITVTGDQTDTIWVTRYDPGSPPSATKCRIYAWERDFKDVVQVGCKLSVWIPSKYQPVVNTSGNPIGRATRYALSDTLGYVYMDVYRSDSLTAGDGTSTVKYNIEFRDPQGTVMGRVLDYEVPDSGSHKIVW